MSTFDRTVNIIHHSEAYAEREERKKRVKNAWGKAKKKLAAALLNADIYDAIYYADNRGEFFKYGKEIITRASKAYRDNDVYTLDQLAEMLKLPPHTRDIPFLTMVTVESMRLPHDREMEAFGILSLLLHNIEAEIVYDIVRRAVYTLPYLKSGYSEAKKRKTRRRKITDTLEHQIRFERHFLERLLTSEGVGINRAKQLSKILTLI